MGKQDWRSYRNSHLILKIPAFIGRGGSLSQKINVALSGASGRMGQAVTELIKKKNSGFSLVATVSLLPSFSKWDQKKIKGVIDFSAPELFSLTLKWCLENKKPFVSGTTALNVSQKGSLKKASRKIPVFYEENMSWGIWQIKQWINIVSQQASEILLEDIHHKNKKDKPSGTALKLQKYFPSHAKKILKIKSIRKGDVFGTHRICFKNKQEEVLLEHKALSRLLFAAGALKALKWLIKKPPGLYSFDDLYGK